MPNDNTPSGSENHGLSPEVADALGYEPSAPSAGDSVTPADGGDKTATSDDTDAKKTAKPKNTTDDTATPKDQKKAVTDPKKSTGNADDPDDSGKDVKEFLVAGKKYTSFDEAVKAVNKIAGTNARLTGDNTAANERIATLESNNAQLKATLEEYVRVNQQWKEYFDNGGEAPDSTKVDIDALVDQKLEKREQTRTEAARKASYKTELDDIFEEDDINDVLPYFQDLVNEYDGEPRTSPRKLYERARAQFNYEKGKKINKLADPEQFDKEVQLQVARTLAKKAALRAMKGGGGNKVDSTTHKDATLAPEVADALRDLL